MIDVALWLNPLDGENPSGAELRNDPRFHELERLTESRDEAPFNERKKPSTEVKIPIDWTQVLSKAEELRLQGRDLRLLVIVTRALANEHGLAGLASGLTLIARTIEDYWDTVHPALRPGASPSEAAQRRIGALSELQNRQGRPDGLLKDLRDTTFFAPRGVGPILGKDLEQAALDERVMLQEAGTGLNAAERAAHSSKHEQLLARVRAGCAAQADQANADMAALVADARAAIGALEAVDAALTTHVEGATATVPDLKRFLERMLTALERGSAARLVTNGAAMPANVPAASEATVGNGHAAETVASFAASLAALPERISSRDDVVKCLDLVVEFYDRTEPSSPIPHLARRVRKMVHMDFVQLMEDLAPSGLKEFRLLAGVPDSKKPSQ